MGGWIGRTATLAGLCLLLWMALAADFRPVSLVGAAAGSVVAAAVSSIVTFERNPLFVSPRMWRIDRLAVYLAVLLLLSYRAVLELAWRLLSGRYRPGVVRIRTRLRSSVGRVVLANSISLVPGTLSLWLEDDHVFVHWFDRKTTHSLRAGRLIKESLERTLERLFG